MFSISTLGLTHVILIFADSMSTLIIYNGGATAQPLSSASVCQFLFYTFLWLCLCIALLYYHQVRTSATDKLIMPDIHTEVSFYIVALYYIWGTHISCRQQILSTLQQCHLSFYIVALYYHYRQAHQLQTAWLSARFLQQRHMHQWQSRDGSGAEATSPPHSPPAPWRGSQDHQTPGARVTGGWLSACCPLYRRTAAPGSWGRHLYKVSTYLQGTVWPFWINSHAHNEIISVKSVTRCASAKHEKGQWSQVVNFTGLLLHHSVGNNYLHATCICT